MTTNNPEQRARELESCPFCGGEGRLGESEDHHGNLWPVVRCETCRAEVSGQDKTDEAAIKAWNTRALTPASQPELERVTDEALLKRVARAIGAAPAKHGGPIGAHLWDVDLVSAARAALSAAPDERATWNAALEKAAIMAESLLGGSPYQSTNDQFAAAIRRLKHHQEQE